MNELIKNDCDSDNSNKDDKKSEERKRKIIKRLFPVTSEKNSSLIKLDDDSLHFITNRDSADKISNILLKYCEKIPKLVKKFKNGNLKITDSTAGAGGNVLSFSKKFKEVIGVEILKTRYDDLVSNCKLYECENVLLHQNDYTQIYSKLKQDIVFIDPPWGGKNYINQKVIRLYLSEIPIEIFTHLIFKNTKTKLVGLKLPLNYDKIYLKNTFNKLYKNYEIIMKELGKMLIILIYIKNK